MAMAATLILLAAGVLVIARPAGAEGVRVTRTPGRIEMDNGLVAVGFARGAQGIALQRLADTKQRVELLAPSESDEWWRIQFGQADQLTAVSSRQGAGTLRVEQSRAGARAILTWRRLGVPGHSDLVVTVRVTLPRGRAETRWSLELEAQKPFALWELTFPILAGLRGEGRSAATPFCWGIEYPDFLTQKPYEATYPAGWGAMQFVAVYDGRTGVYVGADDPRACHKRLALLPDRERKVIRAQIVHYPAGMGEARTRYRLPYPVRLAMVQDWMEAAKAYRQWALKAPWSSQGPLSQRRSTPRWLKEVDVWAQASGTAQEVVEPTKRFAEFMGVPTAVHWYGWHEIPFDTRYPEYFPTKPGFKEGVKALHDAGIRVMPYINGRLWDPATESWAKEGAEAACARKADGEKYIEVYGSKVPLAVMCPQTRLWQDKIAGLVQRLTREIGVDGVYIDQISAAPAVLCFAKGHGHQPGGGSIWVDGYRRLLEKARATLPRGAMLTTEEDADPWMDLLDAFLTVNTPPNQGRVIPLFPAVYSGQTITFGFQYPGPKDLDDKIPFRAKMGRAFCFGAQLGWVAPTVAEPQYRSEGEYLRALARCRHNAHKFLAYGELVGMPEVPGAATLVVSGPNPFGEGTYRFEMPAVVATVWRAADGSLGLAMTNMADEAQVVDVALPRSVYGLGAQAVRLREIGPEGASPAAAQGGDPVRIHRRLEPRSAVVIEVRRAG